MLKRIVALACTLMVGAAFFVSATGCEGEKKPPAPTPTPDKTTPDNTTPAPAPEPGK
jgi:hypothetical protein